MLFEILDRSLVFLGLFAGGEGSQVSPLLRLRVDIARVDTKLAVLKFANHPAPHFK